MSNPPGNAQVVDFLNRHSTLMELNGENPFRVRAVANAARMIEELELDVAAVVADGTLTEIEGVGRGVEELVTEYINTGSATAFERMKEKVPEGLLDVLRIPGLGSKKVKALFEGAGISSIEHLETACREGGLNGLVGFGTKTQENILKSIAVMRQVSVSFLFHEALVQAEELCEALGSLPETERLSIAGSLRRRKEVVKDIDIVLSTDQPSNVSAAFVQHTSVQDVIAQGDTKTSVRLETGIQADLRIVPDHLYPTLLHHFTGSKDHNVGMRSRALNMDMHLNEYGLSTKKGELVPCGDESDLFAALGLDYVPPELREGLGEIEAAKLKEEGLPSLIESKDIRGMLHVHTMDSDGNASVEEMADAVRQRGFSYVGICDHSQSAGYAFGLKPEDVREQHDTIDALNEMHTDFRIFKGIESDIRHDGSLDYDDELLSTFDFVVIALHNVMNMKEAQLTDRVILAMAHPRAHILAHPSGRILNRRTPFPVNLDAVIEAAAEHCISLELNTQPNRLDLDWRYIKKAKQLGVKIAINTDAHRITDLDYIDFGVSIGRKGWLGPDDVINTYSTEAFADSIR